MTNDQILDLDALEVDDGKPPFQFRFDGETFTCSSPNGFDVRDLGDAVGSEDPSTVLVMMLGEEQWEKLDAAEAVFTLKHFETVAEAYFDHYGLSVPKSSRSQRRATKRTR